jgi:hypothetical protein
MKKIIQKNNPLTTTVLRAVLWRKLVWHGLCILRFITTYLIISVEYPTTKIENSICISSKMRSIQIMVHYYKTKKNGSLRPHFTTTPLYVYSVCTTRPGNCAITTKKANLPLKQSPFTHSHSTRNWASPIVILLFVVSNTSDTYYYLVKSPYYYYSSMNNQCCKFKSACVKSNSKVLCSAVSNPLNYHPELSSKNKTLYHNG